MIKRLYTLSLLCFVLIGAAGATTVVVGKPEELKAAVSRAQPGDSILLRAGEWKDVALIIEKGGAAGRPLYIGAQEPGKVKFTGNSFVRFGSDHVTVSGIHFTNGYTSDRAVVEFRNKADQLANHCRLTQCVIENYSRPERFNTDHWIIFWGQHNRVDHCVIGDKLNSGTTLIVELNDERSQNNYHSIDSNYFKGHSPLGSNGGETIRVGVSRYSLTPSRTRIHHNYFERCNGEVEIVSIKSGNNEIDGNTFFECEGGLVLRHGSQNSVTNNVFIGNNKPFTGGVRVINPGHTVRNNLFYRLAGERFHSAFSVLNGVPNSSINRYHQVKDAVIERNTFIECNSIIFGAGKDPERTAAPENVLFRNNYIVTGKKTLYEDANKDGGIRFVNNLFRAPAGITAPAGFVAGKSAGKAGAGFLWKGLRYSYPAPGTNVGANPDQLGLMTDSLTSPAWYPLAAAPQRAPVVHRIAAARSKDLPAIVQQAKDGDIIELTEGATYAIEAPIMINKPLTIRAAAGVAGSPELVNVSDRSLPAFIMIEKGGRLRVEGIHFNSAYKSYGDVQAGITTTTAPMNGMYSLFVSRCSFYNFNESRYSCIRGTKSTYADSVVIDGCVFRNNAGGSIDYSAEKEDKGIYNVEHLLIRNTLFANTLSGAVNVYRGGNDESTTGPEVRIDHCTFSEVENRMQGVVLKLWGVQRASITNSVFDKSGAGGRLIWFEESSWDQLLVDYCNFYRSGRISSFYDKVTGTHRYSAQPVFVDPSRFDFRLAVNSNLKSAAGKPLGVN